MILGIISIKYHRIYKAEQVMHVNLKYCLLAYLNQKKKGAGFTLVELLVVIIIIGILSAIALPTFLNQATRARESEGKQYVGTVTRAQEAYRVSYNAYTEDITNLEVGIETSTENYDYTLNAGTQTASIIAEPVDTALKGFSGGNLMANNGEFRSLTCQSESPGSAAPPDLSDLSDANSISCDSPMERMK